MIRQYGVMDNPIRTDGGNSRYGLKWRARQAKA